MILDLDLICRLRTMCRGQLFNVPDEVLWVGITKTLLLWITYIVQSKHVPQHPTVGESETLSSLELCTYCLQLLSSDNTVLLYFIPGSSLVES